MRNIGTRSQYRGLVLLLLASCLATSSGCAGYWSCRDWVRNGFKVGPEYCKPAAPVAEDWIDADDRRVTSNSAQTADWWLTFCDPVLNDLVQASYAQNLTLREAGMRVLEARAQRGVTAGNIFHQSQNINGDYTHNLLSTRTANTPPGISRSFDNWAITGDLLWEADFWGRFRRAVEAADANLDASVENYDDVLVSLVAEVATAYTNIRTLQQRLEYANQNVKIQQGSLNIADVQFRNGAVSEVDVEQAKLSLTSTEAQIPALEAALRQQNNLLCILLGEPPRDLLPELGAGKIPTAPAEVALGIPCELLRRRPDVRRAEREVAAQSAQIGVAVSDFYPHLTLRGSIGYQSQNLSRLFVPASNTGFIAPGLSWDVLNYGRIKNNVHVQEAAFQALALQYQSAVLSANQEVEDSVNGFLKSQDQTLVLNESVTAASRALELTITQYQQGAVDFNRVFTLQDTKVAQQDAFAASQGNIALNLIGVYKALGGGWEIRLGAGEQFAALDETAPPDVADRAGQEQQPRLPEPPDLTMQEGVDPIGELSASEQKQPGRFARLVSFLRPAEKN
jgi:NodT family efflux transporter outer membrane factor (OMF) lipoprotein